MEGQTTAELVLVAFDRPGAEALVAGAQVGLEGAPTEDEWGINVEAGWEAMKALQRALAGDAEREFLVVAAGMRALDSLMSHDPDLIVIDPGDGTGLLEPDEYRDLYALLELLRSGEAKPDREGLRTRVRQAVEKGDDYFRTLEATDDAHGLDDRHECYVEAVVAELVGAEQ